LRSQAQFFKVPPPPTPGSLCVGANDNPAQLASPPPLRTNCLDVVDSLLVFSCCVPMNLGWPSTQSVAFLNYLGSRSGFKGISFMASPFFSMPPSSWFNLFHVHHWCRMIHGFSFCFFCLLDSIKRTFNFSPPKSDPFLELETRLSHCGVPGVTFAPVRCNQLHFPSTFFFLFFFISFPYSFYLRWIAPSPSDFFPCGRSFKRSGLSGLGTVVFSFVQSPFWVRIFPFFPLFKHLVIRLLGQEATPICTPPKHNHPITPEPSLQGYQMPF